MKKLINKINSKVNQLAIRAKTVLASKSGEGYIDTAVKIIIGVVVGGVILVGLYALFNNVVLLCKAQEMIARKYPAILTDKSKRGEIKNYIAQFLYDTGYTVVGYSMKQVTDRLFCEMAEYSFLTAYLNDPNIEEININGWDDVALTYLDGHIEKSDEQFFSPGHAVDIIKRLLLHSGVTIDNAVPRAEGHLPNNTRITVIKTPIVDEDRGIAASIRMLHPQRVDRENLIRTESITDEMLSFLEMCVCYGVSYVVAGRTSSGKTTLLNSLLGSLPDYKRIYTIENGARELSLIKRDVSGRIKNNVVHTLSRPSDKKESNITQEDLVVTSLRFDPDIICIGEMRDSEASSAIEASSTDHTVVSTVHGDGGRKAHQRIAFLAQKKETKNDVGILMEQAALAFPVIVFVHKLANNARKVMEITECVVHDNGELEYRVLYRYRIKRNLYHGGKFTIEGEFVKENTMSEELREKLLRGGVPGPLLERFMGKEMTA